MPIIKRAPNEKELEALRKIFLKAETDIINEIGRLRTMGNIDYHAVASLERVQAILKQMETECWKYVPRMIEKQFYVRVLEARRISNKGDKFYISSNADGSKVDHPNKRTEYFAYTLLHEIYSMLK